MKPLLVVASLIWSMLSWPAGPVAAEHADLTRSIEALLAAFQSQHGFPGATAAYVLPDGTVGSAAIGLADIEAKTEMTPDTRMLAASVGKTMVGALVLALESEGTLSRSDLISNFLGNRTWFDRLPNAPKITIRHLLTHSAGLPDHVHMAGAARALMEQLGTRHFQPENAIAFVLDKSPLFAAGNGWSYTDTGYMLLGLVIEEASGQTYENLIATRFLKPLGFAQTSSSNVPALPGLAVGYTTPTNILSLPRRTVDRKGTLLWNPAIEWTGGGLISTSHDLARWGDALFSGRALKQPYLDRLLDSVSVDPDTPSVRYGSGIAIYSETKFGRVYGHGGWLPGYVSSLRHYADHGITIAFQINSDVGSVDDSSDLVSSLETALAALSIEALRED